MVHHNVATRARRPASRHAGTDTLGPGRSRAHWCSRGETNTVHTGYRFGRKPTTTSRDCPTGEWGAKKQRPRCFFAPHSLMLRLTAVAMRCAALTPGAQVAAGSGCAARPLAHTRSRHGSVAPVQPSRYWGCAPVHSVATRCLSARGAPHPGDAAVRHLPRDRQRTHVWVPSVPVPRATPAPSGYA